MQIHELIKKRSFCRLYHPTIGNVEWSEKNGSFALRFSEGHEAGRPLVVDEAVVLEKNWVYADQSHILESPISTLNLSIRSRRALNRLLVDTVGDLTRYTEEDLLSCRNFGKTCLNEIKRTLLEKGLKLRLHTP